MTFRLKIKRCDRPGAESYFEEFEIPEAKSLTLLAALRHIRENPFESNGKRVVPVVWEDSCDKNCSGLCTMVIQGRAQPACTYLLESQQGVVTVEPLGKFPVLRDLVVDRSRVFSAFAHVQPWVNLDGSFDLGAGPRYRDAERQVAAQFASCTSCACCLETCPQYTESSGFIGAAALARARYLDVHPNAKIRTSERLATLLNEMGLAGCDNAGNCVKSCPQEIPLTKGIAKMQRLATKRMFGFI